MVEEEKWLCDIDRCENEAEYELSDTMDCFKYDRQLCSEHVISEVLKRSVESTEKTIVKVNKNLESLKKIASKIGKVSCDGVR